MPELIYVSLARFPTEKAHGLQIAQNCEAFAGAGYDVRLWVSNRANTGAMNAIQDIYEHYGVEKTFAIERITGIDLYPYMGGAVKLERIAFYVHLLSYIIVLLLRLAFHKTDILYSRDAYLLFAIKLFFPQRLIAYEIHHLSPSKRGRWLEAWVAQRSAGVFALTQQLRQLLTELGVPPGKMQVEADGVRTARFAHLPGRKQARQQVGWPDDAFIVGFMGRLHIMGIDKGVGLLVDALAQCDDIVLALVGGPDAMALQFKQHWLNAGAAPERFLYSGQIAPQTVPVYLRTFDLCTMPYPRHEFFATYVSPLKLFEYMAVGGTVIASDLPAIAEVVTHGETGYLIPPEDTQALRQAIEILRADVPLREQIGNKARALVLAHYTWDARAKRIRAQLEHDTLSEGKQMGRQS